jgi:hypothetical protein
MEDSLTSLNRRPGAAPKMAMTSPWSALGRSSATMAAACDTLLVTLLKAHYGSEANRVVSGDLVGGSPPVDFSRGDLTRGEQCLAAVAAELTAIYWHFCPDTSCSRRTPEKGRTTSVSRPAGWWPAPPLSANKRHRPIARSTDDPAYLGQREILSSRSARAFPLLAQSPAREK